MKNRQLIRWVLVAFMILAGEAAASVVDRAIPLEILEPAERTEAVTDYPASLGMIFTEGEVTSAPGGAVVDDLGRSVPFDWEVTGWWSAQKSSVKWLLLHFKADSARRYSFILGAEPTTPQGNPLAVTSDGAITVDTGPLQVRLAPGNAPVFESVVLNGKPLVKPGASLFEMIDDEDQTLRCEDWTLMLEESTPLRAVIKAEGVVAAPGREPLATMRVRYQFFAGESLVRMYHTFIWMPRSLDPGAGSIAMRLRPSIGDQGVVRIGLSAYTDDATESPFAPDGDIVAYQDAVDHYAIERDGNTIREGKHLGGWIAVEGGDGRGVGVALKNAWQTYPTALSVRRGEIEVGMWPREAGRFSFEERDIMPDELYYDRHWQYQVSWTREGGPTPFNTRDLVAAAASKLFAQIKAQADAVESSPGKRIVSFLAPPLAARLHAYEPGTPVSDGFRARIAHGMNTFLSNRDFYDAAAWQDVMLKPAAKRLLDKGIDQLGEAELVWFNRLLIESAFPEMISPSDVPHFIHEDSQLVRGGGYVPSGQGGSRTHEINLLFFDRGTARTMPQVNSLTQHPFVMRQSPEHALRAPILGFVLSPLNREKHPDIERALDMYGRASVSRFAESCDYGFLRFGMQRMNYPKQGLYRWMAGMQYDQQLIPWLMFLRGGDRFYYEEAMNTATYAMDMHTNHYNSGGQPTGYMSFVAGMPLPQGPTFSAYNMKIHFLALCHHLTGYKRAGEVIHMAVEGVKAIYPAMLKRNQPVARQLYGMNLFCAHAYEETFDPAIAQLARDSLDETLATHYDPETRSFAGNTQYLYRGLLGLYRLFPEPALRDAMLQHLAACGMPDLALAGPTDNRAAIPLIACPWAYQQTGDERYARIIWDAARNMADTSPNHDWSSPQPVEYPKGHYAAYCHRVLPMLLALGVVEHHDLTFPEASCIHDLFVSMNQPGSTQTVYVRARSGGDLRLKIEGTGGGEAFSVTAYHAATNEKIAETNIERHVRTVLHDLRRKTNVVTFEGELAIPHARQGETYRLAFSGGASTTAAMVLSDEAQVVHQVGPDTIQFFGHSYQYYIGSSVFVMTSNDLLRITRNRPRAGFTVRDAQTREVLARNSILDPLTTEYHVGKGRMIELVMGAGRDNYWKLEGVEPFVSARLEDWFTPEQ